MKSAKVDNSAAEEAARAQREAAVAAENLRKNFQTNLDSENLATVVPGGTAAANDAGVSSQRKRKTGTGLSSSLGIDV